MRNQLRLGTRGSALALAQSRWVAGQLETLGASVLLEVIRTTGDQLADVSLGTIGGTGVFVSEIQNALLEGRIDLAVHSMKDVPGGMPDGLTIAAVPPREDPRDVLVGRTAGTLAALPRRAVVGTSSPRRRAQLLAARPDLEVADLRGNLDTRLRKLDEGQYDAICLAAAGLHRLGLGQRITEYLEPDAMVPAAGQGALAIQVRTGELAIVSALNHDGSALAVCAERAVLAGLGGGCAVPLGVLCTVDGNLLTVRAALCSPDGKTVIRDQIVREGRPEDLGREMADRLRSRGAGIL